MTRNDFSSLLLFLHIFLYCIPFVYLPIVDDATPVLPALDLICIQNSHYLQKESTVFIHIQEAIMIKHDAKWL